MKKSKKHKTLHKSVHKIMRGLTKEDLRVRQLFIEKDNEVRVEFEIDELIHEHDEAQ